MPDIDPAALAETGLCIDCGGALGPNDGATCARCLRRERDEWAEVMEACYGDGPPADLAAELHPEQPATWSWLDDGDADWWEQPMMLAEEADHA